MKSQKTENCLYRLISYLKNKLSFLAYKICNKGIKEVLTETSDTDIIHPKENNSSEETNTQQNLIEDTPTASTTNQNPNIIDSNFLVLDNNVDENNQLDIKKNTHRKSICKLSFNKNPSTNQNTLNPFELLEKLYSIQQKI